MKLAINNYNAKPIVSEAYGEGSTQLNERPAVAVVKSGSSISSLGIRVCVFKMQTFYIEVKSYICSESIKIYYILKKKVNESLVKTEILN